MPAQPGREKSRTEAVGCQGPARVPAGDLEDIEGLEATMADVLTRVGREALDGG